MRFTFITFAAQDVDETASYLQVIPKVPALKIGKQIQAGLNMLTIFPRLGRVDPAVSAIADRRLFRYDIGKYASFYFISDSSLVILGVLHCARDTANLMNQWLG